MHELAVTESVLNIAVDHANKAGAKRVTDIYLVIGRLASIVDDSVQFYWDIISQNTICDKAQLHFKRMPANILCLDCGNEFPLEDELCPCPSCAGSRLKVITGDEFSLDSIEIEK
ncbi:MAG TPA: hydrogenase maturation nickel metallochaperone HypA [Anaerolineaceae bacterium]|nr:hydrogenase maturation nickel metallochaperone HypA [Anaerolineaceae bacterium]